jgi:hypothetical protein
MGLLGVATAVPRKLFRGFFSLWERFLDFFAPALFRVHPRFLRFETDDGKFRGRITITPGTSVRGVIDEIKNKFPELRHEAFRIRPPTWFTSNDSRTAKYVKPTGAHDVPHLRPDVKIQDDFFPSRLGTLVLTSFSIPYSSGKRNFAITCVQKGNTADPTHAVLWLGPVDEAPDSEGILITFGMPGVQSEPFTEKLDGLKHYPMTRTDLQESCTGEVTEYHLAEPVSLNSFAFALTQGGSTWRLTDFSPLSNNALNFVDAAIKAIQAIKR